MNSFEKLKAKLSELFQLDQADLDFGIYRVMNARRDEVNRFLESDLLPQVRKAFKQYQSADKATLKQELDKAIEGARALGIEPENVPKVKELQAEYESSAVDIAALENEVYDHLFSFFSRYYDGGDFISLRRYKKGVYAIPYEGEEVKLHWTNHDQYYIKTSEYFRDYAFKTPSGHCVHFKIIEADTEKDNIKAANGNDRRFLLHGDKPAAEENGELIIRFEYRPDDEKRRQDAINAKTSGRIFADLNDKKRLDWKERLDVMWKRVDGKETDKTILDKHLFDYTRRNTFDYFIHKDLGAFLRRELDFYIKNEVMRLDDIEEETAPRVEQYLLKIKVIRQIAHKIIAFLAQIEDFQKKLWLKKKFVIETNYCVTLDRVPEKLYPEITANEAQREEWVRLFAIDEIKTKSGQLKINEKTTVVYSEPLTVEFLKANPFLVIDTEFFNTDFKEKLLASFDDVEDQCDGVLVRGENFQSLNMMQNMYRGQVKCVYIDPPYNTSASEIIYKNDFKHSSWLAFITGRLLATESLMCGESILCITIDDFEFSKLFTFMEGRYSRDRLLGVAAIKNNPSGRATPKGFSIAHEYAIFLSKGEQSAVGRLSHTEEQVSRYKYEDQKGRYEWVNLRKHGGANANRSARPKLFYPIFVSEEVLRFPKADWDVKSKSWILFEKPNKDEQVVWPIDAKGGEKTWKLGIDTAKASLDELSVRRDQQGQLGVYRKARIRTEGTLPRTLWDKKEYSATEYGTNLLTNILGSSQVFSFPKSLYAVKDCLLVAGADPGAVVLDYFAGSGTTGHAVIDLNREDEGGRKYILVEMGEHFDTALKPRILKVVYSKGWKNGKPVSRDGVSHMFKYIRLESYEDALTNIELQRNDHQQLLLNKADGFRESYMLKYMLDVESRGSQTLLNIDNFDDPWNYQLLVGAGSVGETKPVNVDLVETFNWLLGLKATRIERINSFQLVKGENPAGEKVLVIWRKIRDLDERDPAKIAAARQNANIELEAFFKKQQYNRLDSEFDIIYVNGDNNLMNVPLDPDKKGLEPRYKVRLIEEEFKQLMFDVKDI
ncbi:MAG: DNA methyltransferase [Desulfobacterales bacterium]|nr:DNA methyltransferase [Desulfobacterales bacterium]